MRSYARRWGLLAALALVGATGWYGWAQEVEAEDPLDLVALLVRDAQWERAAVALADADDPRRKGDDLARYRTLEGLVAAGQERWEDAALAFRAALDAAAADPRGDGPDPTLHLQLAQALLRAGRPAEAVVVLDGAPEAVLALATTWRLKAQAASAAGDPEGAWVALEEGGRRFPDQADFLRQQVILLVRLGLYQEAITRGGGLLERPDAVVEDVLVLAESLRRGGAPERAAVVLAQGRLRFPERKEPWVQSAALALALGRAVEAASYLGVAAELDPELAYEAAEVWRQAGEPAQALRLNAQVVDPARKARQRLGLLLEAEAWDRAVALEERALRLELEGDGAVAYGLAYARFRTGDLDRAEDLLRGISDPKVFQLATGLRSAMDACRQDPGACP